MSAPDNVDRLSPKEAWEEGYRSGKEELARKMAADQAAQGVIQVLDQAKDRDARIAALEQRLVRFECELGDHAGVVVRLVRRVSALEQEG